MLSTSDDYERLLDMEGKSKTRKDTQNLSQPYIYILQGMKNVTEL